MRRLSAPQRVHAGDAGCRRRLDADRTASLVRSTGPRAGAGLAAVIVALSLVAVATGAARLTAYGATRKAWAAHHIRDPNPKLIKGCCYLPRQADGIDRYYAVQRDDRGRVLNYSMHFSPRVSASLVRVLLRRHELPVDARLVRSKRKAGCLIIQYRSAAAKRAMGTATVGAAFYSSETGRYSGRVKDVIISGAMTSATGC
jgi:hypothetical protein